MTSLRAATVDLLQATTSLVGWTIRDSDAAIPEGRPQIVVASAWDRLDLQAPPYPGMQRAGTLRLLASWPVETQAASGSWATTCDALEALLWDALVHDPDWLAAAAPESWESSAGLDRLDRGLVARLEVSIRCVLPWGTERPGEDLLTAVRATVDHGEQIRADVALEEE